MSELHRALGDIRKIRQQVAGRTEFAGYGPAAMAATGLLALLGAAAQVRLLPFVGSTGFAGGSTATSLLAVRYLVLWIGIAAAAAGITAATALTRSRRLHSGLSDEMIAMAAQQFLPALASGILLTIVLGRCVPQAVWMLPGLWQVIYSLGIFASCRLLPRPMLAAGVWYLVTGLLCLSIGDARALAPWTMGAAFGGGQMLVAGVLRFASAGATDGE